MKTEKIYLNDKREIVKKEFATMAVVRTLDQDGRLIRERWEFVEHQAPDASAAPRGK